MESPIFSTESGKSDMPRSRVYPTGQIGNIQAQCGVMRSAISIARNVIRSITILTILGIAFSVAVWALAGSGDLQATQPGPGESMPSLQIEK